MAQPSEEALWDRVAEAVDAVAQQWERCLAGDGEPPRLVELLTGDGAVDGLVLPELVKTDLEYRWSTGRGPKKLDDYAAELPGLGPVEQVPVELIYEELQVRMQAGDPVDDAELQSRFPHRVEVLLQMLGGMAVSGSPTESFFGSTLAGVDRPEAARIADFQLNDPKPFDHLNPGDVVDDFELLLPLGTGAFAKVFLARQVSMERLVALKVSAHCGSEPQTLAQLEHPNIVRVYDQRCCDDPDAKLLYMEVVPGGTLRELLGVVRNTPANLRHGRLVLDTIDATLGSRGQAPPEGSAQRRWMREASWPLAVCQIGAQLADGLAYAHGKGVLHRDVKPANVLLSAKGSPKLADFNISFNGGRVGEDPADTFGGSLAYMSPEQLEACHPLLGGSPQMVRQTSDVYSLGVLLWELLCGQRPFEEEPHRKGSLASLQRMVDRRRAVDPRELARMLPADCPASLREVLLRCLQPERADRFQNAQELAAALRLCLDPTSWRLMHNQRSRLSGVALLLPVLWVALASLVPNLLAGVFNYHYNESWIVDQQPGLHDRFEKVQLVINLVVFPLGLAAGLVCARRVAGMLWSGDPRRVGRGARKLLLFGRFVAGLAAVLWLASGIAFPIAIDWGQPLAERYQVYSHFILSLILCGCIGAAYPYFLVTALAVHYYLPALVRIGGAGLPMPADARAVRRASRFFLALTALVPMLSVWMVVAYGEQVWPVLVASGVGMIGFLVMYSLERLIEDDLSSLERLADESCMLM